MTDKVKVAIRKSIEHWIKMIVWVLKQDLTKPPASFVMLNDLGESWYSDSCPLCLLFIADAGTSNCDICPLGSTFIGTVCMRCPNTVSIWAKVNKAETWLKWLKYAIILVSELQRLLYAKKEK